MSGNFPAHRQKLLLKKAPLIVLAVLIAAVFALVFALGGFGLLAGLTPVGGLPPTYQPVDYDPYLTTAAQSAMPILRALRSYRGDHQSFPQQAAELALYLPVVSGTPAAAREFVLGWDYVRGDKAGAFTLSRKLGWDPSLLYRFDGGSGSWSLDPGDGSPEKLLQLKP